MLDYFTAAKVFGCTATPDRTDGKALSAIFEKVITPLYLGELIKGGWLASLRRHLVRIESISLADLATPDGDYTATDLERILTAERPLHEVVQPTIELAQKRPTIVFAATVRHAECLTNLFNRYRPGSAAVIHGGMAVAERRQVISDFEAGRVQFVCSCALLLRGVNLPFVSCIAMARPTHSRSLYCQAIGRGTRLHQSKDYLLVLDFTDNSTEHSLVSPVDIFSNASEEVKERAREIIDSEQRGDVQEILERADSELRTDAALRERVRAKVEFNTKQLDIGVKKGLDWDSQPLGKMKDTELAAILGVTYVAVQLARKKRRIPPFKPIRTVIDFTTKVHQLKLISETIPPATRARRFDINGKTIGELTILQRDGSKGNTPLWHCRCSCGKLLIVEGQRLNSKNPRKWKRSCGHDSTINKELIEIRGIKKPLLEWSRLTGIKYTTIRARIKRGWTIEKAIG